MKAIAIISEKGGVGKTTLAVNLAVAAEKHGLATAIFDLDPRANSTIWGDRRETKIPAVVPAQAPRLGRLLEQAKENDADLVIFDTPGNGLDTAAACVPYADAILIPTRPDQKDLLSIPPSVRLARDSGKPFFVVIIDAPSNGSEVDEARAAITAEGVEVAPVVWHNRKAFGRRFTEGLAALDIEPNGLAAAEILELLLWICQKVILLPSEQVTELTEARA